MLPLAVTVGTDGAIDEPIRVPLLKFGSCMRLTVLHLKKCRGLLDQYVEKLFNALSALTDLDLCNCGVTAIFAPPQLQLLTLDGLSKLQVGGLLVQLQPTEKG